MTRTIVSVVLVGILYPASGCADQWVTEIMAGLIAAHDPVVEVIGGDNDGLFYMVNRGADEPEDLYRYDLRTHEKQLLRSVPTNTASRIATDGRYLAFTQGESVPMQGYLVPVNNVLVVSDLSTGNEWTVYEGAAGSFASIWGLAVEAERVVYMTGPSSPESNMTHLVVEHLGGGEPVSQFESKLIHEVHLCGDYLAYTASDDSPTRIMLHDLGTDEAITVAEDVSNDIDSVYIELTQDTVVWAVEDWDDFAETPSVDVSAYDIHTRTTRHWVREIPGTLSGATRDHFLAVEGRLGFILGSASIVISRYDAEGRGVVLDKFPYAQGIGAATVVGDWAVWTNEKWQLVLEPLAGGDRRVIDP